MFKGLSLEQVDELYEKIPNAWQSAGFVPTVSFAEVQHQASMGEDKGSVFEQETAVADKSE